MGNIAYRTEYHYPIKIIRGLGSQNPWDLPLATPWRRIIDMATAQ